MIIINNIDDVRSESKTDDDDDSIDKSTFKQTTQQCTRNRQTDTSRVIFITMKGTKQAKLTRGIYATDNSSTLTSTILAERCGT